LRPIALLVLLLVSAVAAAATTAAPLTVAEVQSFIQQFDAAERAGDVAALGAALAPDCRVEMRTVVDGHTHVAVLSHDEYLADFAEFYGSLDEVVDYAHDSGAPTVTMATDGATATAVRVVTEAFTLDDEHLVFRTDETTRLERRGNGLAITALSTRPHAD
jgi:hypothetical protein